MKSNHFRILAVDDERPVLDLYDKILCSIRQVHGSLPSLDNEQLSEPEKSANRRPAASNQHSVSASFDLTLCAQAEEAVEVVRVATENENPFALVFMDIRLPPGPDGLWAAEQIRHLDPNMGIVLVTGYFDTDLEEIERRVPPSDKILYLQKPFYSKEIWQIALSMCTKWQTENELRAVQEGLETTVEKRTSALLEANRRLKVEIEKRVMAEEVSRVSEANFRNMILGNADGIIIFDRDEIVRFVNPAAESLFVRKEEEFVGELLGYPLVAGEKTELDIVRGTETPVVAEMRVVETKWQGEMAYLASLRDITGHNRTKDELQESLNNLQKIMTETVRAMATMAECRDPYTAGHQQRVAHLSRAIAKEMGLPLEQIEGLYWAALVHDIGKMTVPAEILSRPGKLGETEFKLIQIHPMDGARILKDIEFPWPIAQIVLQHQERMDGSGYPEGLSGEEILIEAKILSVADVVEAMASHRPYRAALGIDKALEEISENRGLLYDPQVVDACLKVFNETGYDFSDPDTV